MNVETILNAKNAQDLDRYTKDDFVEFAAKVQRDYLRIQATAFDTDGVVKGYKLGTWHWDDREIRKMRKPDLMDAVFARIIKPIQEHRKAQAEAKEMERQAKLVAERDAGKTRAKLEAAAAALVRAEKVFAERVDSAKAKIVANPFDSIASYADDLWLNSYCLWHCQGWLNYFRGEPVQTKLDAEILEQLEGQRQADMERHLTESFNQSTNPMSNVMDTCKYRAEAWEIRLLGWIIKAWKKEVVNADEFDFYIQTW